MRGLKDKVVIVTGSGRGIGKATAQRFAEEGAKVVVAEFDEATGGATAEAIGATFVQVDVSKRESVHALMGRVREELGGIDVLVNNAGVLADSTLKKMTDDQFDKVIGVNLRGTFMCGQEAAAHMRDQGKGGAILNAASVVALYGNFGQTNYVASKTGVIGMTKVWARELGRDQIRVNAVAPGFIETDMTASMPQKVIDMMVSKVPLQRMGHVDDIAATYAFLASDDAKYISGAVISVDGAVVT